MILKNKSFFEKTPPKKKNKKIITFINSVTILNYYLFHKFKIYILTGLAMESTLATTTQDLALPRMGHFGERCES
jgi:HJR/Mrr/RecB family endonuclease